MKDVLSVLKMIVNKRMIFLIPLFACLGFQSIFVNSMYNRQIVKTENVSLYMIVYTVVEMFAGFIHGWGLDKLGLYPMLILYILLGMTSMILCYYANFWQNASFFILYVLFSLTDSGFQTFVGHLHPSISSLVSHRHWSLLQRGSHDRQRCIPHVPGTWWWNLL